MNTLPNIHLQVSETASGAASPHWPAVMAFPQRSQDTLFLPPPKRVFALIPGLWLWLDVMRLATLWKPTIH
ncbi:hypothetical protein [Vibrio metschnikovii]|uniref:hypothetical protein n=1 Tax=Vibrio metschnikovii TaxID=28172 RepID=UPI001C306181|nr:hypothetical protein [Vibrio metschnikovii]